jgi:teichuronic acid biosynthesis glycosyltransferase TuaG
MPVYNTELYLNRAIESIVHQSYINWELIIINDCSTDSSFEIAKKWADSDTRISLIENKINSGSGVSRNYGIERSAGDFIAFLDSDDIWCHNKLEIQITFMLENSVNFSYGIYGYIDSNGNKNGKFNRISSYPISYENLIKNNEIGCLTAVYSSKSLGKCFLTNHRNKQDYGLWLSILKRGGKATPINEVLGYYQIRKDSATGNKLKMLKKHLFFLKETQNISYPKAFYYTIWWFYFASIKRF